MKKRHFLNKTGIFMTLNWLVFWLCFAWVSVRQGSLTWWMQLNWQSWLTDLGAILQLGTLKAGTFWILWLALGSFFTIAGLLGRTRFHDDSKEDVKGKTAEPTDLSSRVAKLESDPLLQEKISRLQQVLGTIR